MDGSILLIASLWSLLFLAESSEISLQEKMILQIFGLNGRPNPINPAPVPKKLWTVFNKGIQKDNPCRMEGFEVPGNILRSYRDQGPFVSSWVPQESLCLRKHLFYNLSAVQKKEKITLGQLEIKFKYNTYHGQDFQLRLYRTLQMSLKRMRKHKTNRKLLVSRSFRLLHNSLYFNLTKVAEDWVNPEKNMGLILEIFQNATKANISSSQCEQIHSFIHTSLLTISLDQTSCKISRAKRSFSPAQSTPSNICRKRSFYIDFKDVGWHNWVIAPRGYMANYCHGECPYPLTELLKGTNHAVLQTLVHSTEPEITPLPCCAPTKLSPISMLYYDNNDNVVLRHYEDMVVDECGCK
ncbi:growth/differentiation factor 3 [Pelodytes ibericus]